LFRHLPPTATPLTPADLRRGLVASPETITQFQTALAEYLGARACFPAASGRTALYLLLTMPAETGGGTARREVVLPAYTCPALARVTLDAGLLPRLVDVAPQTLAFRPDELAAAIGEQTLAVICVHPFGIPQPLDEAISLAHAAGAIVIEDAAQAMGACLDGRPVGLQGDFGLFSLGPGKPLSTGGGGVVCTNDVAMEQKLAAAWAALPGPTGPQSALALLRLAAFWPAFHPAGWWLGARLGLHRFGDSEAGQGYRLRGLTPAQAGVGLALLEKLAAINGRRRENARRLIEVLGARDGIELIQIPEMAAPIYLRLPLLVSDEARREILFQRLWAAGIGVGKMYRHSLAALYPHLTHGPLPGAEYVARHLLTLPTHHYLTEADFDAIRAICE
jgi:dTDP-4-amino-4,6-dideoxygalactose transaminase